MNAMKRPHPGGASHGVGDHVGDGNVQRLLAARKLSLIVDLDHTLLHCGGSDLDPATAQQLEATRPDVHRISLSKQGPTRPASDHWIKLRPGLRAFLDACQVCGRVGGWVGGRVGGGVLYYTATHAYAPRRAYLCPPRSTSVILLSYYSR